MSEERNQAIRDAYQVLCKGHELRRTLRRIEKDPTEALYHEGAHTALGRLQRAGMSNRDGHALDALLLMSHVEKDVPGRLGQQLKRAGVKPARFRRLATADRDELLVHLRHMVQQCKGRVSVVDLAWTAYRWGKERREGSQEDTAKERLAYDYYTNPKTKEENE